MMDLGHGRATIDAVFLLLTAGCKHIVNKVSLNVIETLRLLFLVMSRIRCDTKILTLKLILNALHELHLLFIHPVYFAIVTMYTCTHAHRFRERVKFLYSV
jgi:hypothetical protein